MDCKACRGTVHGVWCDDEPEGATLFAVVDPAESGTSPSTFNVTEDDGTKRAAVAIGRDREKLHALVDRVYGADWRRLVVGVGDLPMLLDCTPPEARDYRVDIDGTQLVSDLIKELG